MLKEDKKIKPLMWNAMFEVVFDNNIEVVIAMINDCCGTNYIIGKDKIKLEKRDIPRKNINEVSWVCDFIITINNYNLYNIEINKRYYPGLYARNWNYILKLHSSRIPTGIKYRDLNKYSSKQINFNKFKNDDNLALDIEGWTSYKTSKKKHKNVGVFQFDIEFCYDIVYTDTSKDITNVPKLYRWGALFVAESIKEIDYILGSDMLKMETKNNLLNKIDEASQDEIILSKISLEEDFEGSIRDEIEIAKKEAAKKGREDGRKKGIIEGRKEGIEQGIEQGIEKNTICTIKAMLKKNYSITEIADITGATIEYVTKIKSEL